MISLAIGAIKTAVAAFRALQRLEELLADRALYESHVPFDGVPMPVTDWPWTI